LTTLRGSFIDIGIFSGWVDIIVVFFQFCHLGEKIGMLPCDWHVFRGMLEKEGGYSTGYSGKGVIRGNGALELDDKPIEEQLLYISSHSLNCRKDSLISNSSLVVKMKKREG
jgi:hypothetical protein